MERARRQPRIRARVLRRGEHQIERADERLERPRLRRHVREHEERAQRGLRRPRRDGPAAEHAIDHLEQVVPLREDARAALGAVLPREVPLVLLRGAHDVVRVPLARGRALLGGELVDRVGAHPREHREPHLPRHPGGAAARKSERCRSPWSTSITAGAPNADRSITASAASTVNPPRKTAHCPSALCSSGDSVWYEASIAAASVACLSPARAPCFFSRSKRLDIRWRSARAPITAIRGAHSSIASGSPSSSLTSAPTKGASASVNVYPGRARCVHFTNSSTASPEASPRGGSGSGPSSKRASPARWSGSRDVMAEDRRRRRREPRADRLRGGPRGALHLVEQHQRVAARVEREAEAARGALATRAARADRLPDGVAHPCRVLRVPEIAAPRLREAPLGEQRLRDVHGEPRLADAGGTRDRHDARLAAQQREERIALGAAADEQPRRRLVRGKVRHANPDCRGARGSAWL